MIRVCTLAVSGIIVDEVTRPRAKESLRTYSQGDFKDIAGESMT
jgi:hypothetical protein